MKTISAPEADMLLVSESSRNQRKSIMNFAPKIGLAIVDYGRLQEIDNFYLDCQNFRDYYRDPYNKLPRPQAFKRHYGKCGGGNRYPDKCSEQLMQPPRWVAERQPVIYPLNYRSHMVLDEGIRLGGLYNSDACTKYKR
ncbi:hypothetical protein CVS40_4911 [Lucilia cuprina]|nr:hypothetical protein CVS40_4911 [Lucilia cuprina]